MSLLLTPVCRGVVWRPNRWCSVVNVLVPWLALLINPSSQSLIWYDLSYLLYMLISLQRSCLETQLMVQCCQRASAMARSVDKSIKPITHLHLEGLMKQVEMILEGSFCLPRYFFQVLQSTSVKLAITPQPRVNGEYLSVPSGSQLSVKVEGVIQHGSQPDRFRSVSGVVLTLSSQLTSRLTIENKSIPMKPGDGQVVLQQSVTPHRDFFTGQFLLALGGGGQHQVTVEAAVQDNSGNVWTTGPRSTLTVKTLEDSSTSRARTSF
ncbi:Integrator complex subunit 7 [Homalodisca vitripennis]|nr:Integrator complex subunit 7 [Homalodisca vitripennis]